jgi:hypothetical protein
MMRGGIQILAMRSWGELGNLLAARTLAEVLSLHLDVEVQILEAETLFPRFAEIGARIRELVVGSRSPAEVQGRYLALVEALSATFGAGLEAEPPDWLDAELLPLIAHFEETRPLVVCGMKGIITRLCLPALRRAGQRAGVINFVTNEGLLRFPFHRSPLFPCTLVPLARSRDYAVTACGFSPAAVQVVGRLVATRGLAAEAPAAPPTDRPRVIVFSNRGGDAYRRVLGRLAQRAAPPELRLMAHGEPALVAELGRLRERHGLDGWSAIEGATQPRYFECLAWLTSSRRPLLVSKAGPNTALEAAYFGAPTLLLDSGLPMEEWVLDLVNGEGLGRASRSVDDLLGALDAWLDDPTSLDACRERARAFARAALDQDFARRAIVAAFRERLEQAAN